MGQFYLLLLHQKLMQFMVPNKLFRVAEFAWKSTETIG